MNTVLKVRKTKTKAGEQQVTVR